MVIIFLQSLKYNYKCISYIYHTRTHAHTHTRTHAHTHTRTHAHTHARMHARTHANMCTCTLVCVHVHMYFQFSNRAVKLASVIKSLIVKHAVSVNFTLIVLKLMSLSSTQSFLLNPFTISSKTSSLDFGEIEYIVHKTERVMNLSTRSIIVTGITFDVST